MFGVLICGNFGIVWCTNLRELWYCLVYKFAGTLVLFGVLICRNFYSFATHLVEKEKNCLFPYSLIFFSVRAERKCICAPNICSFYLPFISVLSVQSCQVTCNAVYSSFQYLKARKSMELRQYVHFSLF